MRYLLLVGALLLAPVLAQADETVAGKWQASFPDDNIVIKMEIQPGGTWNSTTEQHGHDTAKMSGTYQQKKTNDTSGELIFTPTKAEVATGAHAPAQVERDQYKLEDNNRVLHLDASGDVMVFKKQQ